MPPLSDAVDDAVVAKLTEPTLAGLMPAGVFSDVGRGEKFVLVSLLHHEDTYMFGGTAYERFLYLAKAVEKSNSKTGAVRTAGRRIHELLHDVDLEIPGYRHMLTRRVERVVISETDDIDPDIRWQHNGGHYEVLVSPT